MMAHGDTLGVLYVETGRADANDSPKPFAESEQRLASIVAEHLSMALANLRLRETLRNQAIRDPLTGLFNRRYMEETLDREVHRAIRRDAPLSVIMIDADHFKQFNDVFGHEAGDTILHSLGTLMQTSVRAEDIACRYGGEEFTIILPEAGVEVALERAEMLRIDARRIIAEHRGRPLGTITLSLGIAVLPDQDRTGDMLLRVADAALYRAKAEGRDRVVMAGATTELDIH